jgi:hypothetical protein
LNNYFHSFPTDIDLWPHPRRALPWAVLLGGAQWRASLDWARTETLVGDAVKSAAELGFVRLHWGDL